MAINPGWWDAWKLIDDGISPGKKIVDEKPAVKSVSEERSWEGQKGIELISCKRQPGNLLISRHACRKRYLLSLSDEKNTPSDVFGMVRKSGLDICRNCPEGRISFKNSEKRTASFGRNALRTRSVKAALLKPE